MASNFSLQIVKKITSFLNWDDFFLIVAWGGERWMTGHPCHFPPLNLPLSFCLSIVLDNCI